MSRRLRTVAAVAGSALVLVLAGACSAGFNAPTENEYAPGEGVIGQVGDLKLRNVVLVTDADDENAAVIATVVNDGTDGDRLVSLSVGEDETSSDLPQSIGAGDALTIGPVDADVAATAEWIDFSAGDFVDVEFEFESAGSITLQAVVVAPRGDYEDFAPEPSSSPTSS